MTNGGGGNTVSTLLRAWSGGDQGALDLLTPIVYKELHRLASRYMKGERSGHSLQTTALVNEAYLRLADYKHMQWQDRAQVLRCLGPGDATHPGGARSPPQSETGRRHPPRIFGGSSLR